MLVKKLKLHKEYWVCDTGMAGIVGCESHHNNVFKYNPTYFNDITNTYKIITDSYYRYFTTKKEAVDLSKQIDIDDSNRR